jgi:acetolactate synthase-1/2/3 large subunit
MTDEPREATGLVGDEGDVGLALAIEPADEPVAAPAPPQPAERAGAAEPVTPPTVGRYVADVLRAAGVRTAYTVPGESFLGLLEALEPAGIHVLAARHEGGAAFMAEAYGQLTGRPSLCLATRAVGAANLAIGIQTAREDSTPLFAVVGGVERRLRGRDAFQEADVVGSIGRLAKWSIEITTAADVPEAMAEAVRQALSDRPGPVLLVLPEDLLDDPVPVPTEPEPARAARGGGDRIDPDAIASILRTLTAARRPLIVAGAGVLRARATSDLVRLAELLRVPVMTSWRRGDAFPNDHELYLGMTGYGSPPSVRARLESADAVLVLGSRLNEITTFGYAWPRPDVTWAHVDVAPDAAAHRPPADVVVRADARVFIRAALARLAGAVLDKETADARSEETVAARVSWEEETAVPESTWTGPGVDPAAVIGRLRAALPDAAILVTDAGNFAGWAARHFRFRRPGTFIGPTSGAMGYAVPAAIAAALIHRDRPVVALAGDGGFAMTMAEIETAVRAHARPIVLVFDNQGYGTIAMHQRRRGDHDAVATDLGPVDFATVAEGLGALGLRVGSTEAFGPALETALASDRPAVIALELDRRWVGVDDRPGD